jgi:two-component system, NarL family, response regulator DesR
MIIMRVILADDSALILERLQALVTLCNQAEIVASCDNGTKALEAIRNLKPDLAIVDLQMPGLTGLEVLTAIRKTNKKVKIIILTFFSTDYHKNMSLDAGADYFFSKVDEFEKISQVLSEMSILPKIRSKFNPLNP